jgi:lipopolysaccharide biosynthesis glycosyltransferase
LLEEYASATEVITPLLHCFLPCRALGTPVKFTHAQLIRDTRFEGLIDISEDDRIKLTNAMRENVAVIMKLVVDGADENRIYQVWRDRNASRVTAIRNRMREKSGNLPSIVQNIGMDWCKNLDRKTLRNGIFGEQPKRDESFTDISFCYDANFVRIVYATIRSLITNTQANVRLNLLTRDVCEIEILRLSKTFPDTDFVWIDMTEVTFKELNLLSHTTVSTMDRLFLPYLLDYADRVLYLDVDMAILGDIADLATLDLQGRMLGARRSIYHTWSSGFGLCSLIEKNLLPAQIPQFRREFTYAQFMNYKTFNAGMLLMDLGQLRNLNFTDKMLTIVQRYDINDQYAINLFAAGNFVEIEPKWNHFATQEMVLDPKIVHYTGIVKPWHHEYCPKAEKWRQYIVPSDGIIRTSALEQSYYK